MDANRKRGVNRSGKSKRKSWAETLETRIGLDVIDGLMSASDWPEEGVAGDLAAEAHRPTLYRPRRGRIARRRTLAPTSSVSRDGRTLTGTTITQGGHPI